MSLENECRVTGVICDEKFEVRKTKDGTEVVNFCVAVTRPGDSKGADYVDCCLFGKRVKAITDYAQKGTLIQVLGKLQVSLEEYKGVKFKKTVINVDEFKLIEKFNFPKAKKEEGTAEDKLANELERGLRL